MKPPCMPDFWCDSYTELLQSFWFAIRTTYFTGEKKEMKRNNSNTSLHINSTVHNEGLWRKRKIFSSLDFWGFDTVVRILNNEGYVWCCQKFKNLLIFLYWKNQLFLHESMRKSIFLCQSREPFYFFPLPCYLLWGSSSQFAVILYTKWHQM